MPRETQASLYKVAQAYYEDGQTQEQIARRLGLSRVKVSRLLARARQERIVQITLVPPAGSHAEMERALERRYGLDEVILTPGAQDPRAMTQALGVGAAECLLRCLAERAVLGLTWGSAMRGVVEAMAHQAMPNLRVVQLLGGLGRPDADEYGADLAHRLAQTLGGKARLLASPGIVGSAAVAQALRDDPQIADTLALGAQADVALVGLGRPTPGSVILQAGILAPEELAALEALGAVGDIGLCFFDAQGRAITHEISQRIIGLTLEQYRAIPRVIGVAGGPAKYEVVRAAVHGRLVSVLVTDVATGERLLAE
jgi:DNA-binding transcriptional regulator LsrR (DeoR family)